MRPDLGFMLTPEMGNNPDLSATPWAADNGCFKHPERFDLGQYLYWLSSKPSETCMFVTAPDVVGDAKATWKRSARVLPVIRRMGYKAAFIAQDGAEDLDWDAFDALFIGGTDPWKFSAESYALGDEAKARGKWLHWGRVNSLRRLMAARAADADSADGTYIAFAPDLLLPRVCRWLDVVNAQAVLL